MANRQKPSKATLDRRREYSRWYRISRRYGLTKEAYEALLAEQTGTCYICKRTVKQIKKPLCVDHDHRTGEIRGLLCSRCNRGLEHFKDKPEYFKNAAEYLLKPRVYGTVPCQPKPT